MPYIPCDERPNAQQCPATAGQLNYAITKLISGYIWSKGESYSVFNDCVGVLECVKLETHRRLIAPYEYKKMVEHGDVYEHGK